MSLSDVLHRWSGAAPRASRTLRSYAGTVALLAFHGLRELGDADPDRVAAFFEERLLVVSASTAAREGAVLSVILGHAARLGLLAPERLAAVRLVLPRWRRPRSLSARFLSADEVARLLAEARRVAPRLVFPLRVGLLLGPRAGELARLRWEDMVLDARLARIRRAPEWGEHGSCKTGERVVPVCLELLELLREERERARSPYLFPSQPFRGSVPPSYPFASDFVLRRFLRRAGSEAGIARPSWCLVRHTRASTWVAAGVPLAKVARWLGHTVGICERYYAGLAEAYDADVDRSPAA